MVSEGRWPRSSTAASNSGSQTSAGCPDSKANDRAEREGCTAAQDQKARQAGPDQHALKAGVSGSGTDVKTTCCRRGAAASTALLGIKTSAWVARSSKCCSHGPRAGSGCMGASLPETK